MLLCYCLPILGSGTQLLLLVASCRTWFLLWNAIYARTVVSRGLYLAIFIIIRLKVDPIGVNLATQIALVIKARKINLKVDIIRIDWLVYIYIIEYLFLLGLLTLN